MTWKQERPSWCPHQTCGYRMSSQALVCVGQLPKPEPHGEGMNTHRICLHGAKDDGEWTLDLQINQGDGYAIWRLLKGLFGFGQVRLQASLERSDGEGSQSLQHHEGTSLPESELSRIRRETIEEAAAIARDVADSEASAAIRAKVAGREGVGSHRDAGQEVAERIEKRIRSLNDTKAQT